MGIGFEWLLWWEWIGELPSREEMVWQVHVNNLDKELGQWVGVVS